MYMWCTCMYTVVSYRFHHLYFVAFTLGVHWCHQTMQPSLIHNRTWATMGNTLPSTIPNWCTEGCTPQSYPDARGLHYFGSFKAQKHEARFRKWLVTSFKWDLISDLLGETSSTTYRRLYSDGTLNPRELLPDTKRCHMSLCEWWLREWDACLGYSQLPPHHFHILKLTIWWSWPLHRGA